MFAQRRGITIACFTGIFSKRILFDGFIFGPVCVYVCALARAAVILELFPCIFLYDFIFYRFLLDPLLVAFMFFSSLPLLYQETLLAAVSSQIFRIYGAISRGQSPSQSCQVFPQEQLIGRSLRLRANYGWPLAGAGSKLFVHASDWLRRGQ